MLPSASVALPATLVPSTPRYVCEVIPLTAFALWSSATCISNGIFETRSSCITQPGFKLLGASSLHMPPCPAVFAVL